MLAHDVGFPAAEGGAAQLTAALVRRLEAHGGRVLCSYPVTEIEVSSGRATAAIVNGERFAARHAVLADVSAPALYGGLVSWDHLPACTRDDISRFQWDWATVKVDWALSSKVPWEAPEVGTAGTVHLAESLDSLTQYGADVAMCRIPAKPFVLIGQLSTTDPTRSPPGTEALYAYTHVPRVVKGDAGDGSVSGAWDESDCEAMAARIEDRIEYFAPGFKALIQQRNVLSPVGLEAHDGNLVGGAINGGTSELHQQLFFRPTPGLGRPETPIRALYLASSSAHPGGGVHGACGANAARAALGAANPLLRYTVVPAIAALQRAVTAGGPARQGS
jgi:phytoene dehydrogenase-like protein